MIRDASLAVSEWVDEVELLNSDEAEPVDVEEMTAELFDGMPVAALFAVLPKGTER